jgi:hypothetical protein
MHTMLYIYVHQYAIGQRAAARFGPLSGARALSPGSRLQVTVIFNYLNTKQQSKATQFLCVHVFRQQRRGGACSCAA